MNHSQALALAHTNRVLETNDELKEAVHAAMESEPSDVQRTARVQELLDIKVTLKMVPFLEKIRRIKEGT